MEKLNESYHSRKPIKSIRERDRRGRRDRFSLDKGEIFGFLGPNGAGKTTTVKLLIGQFTGIILIDSGLLWGLGTVLAALDALLMRGTAGNFTYEKLLK